MTILNRINYITDPHQFTKSQSGSAVGEWRKWQSQYNSHFDLTKSGYNIIMPGQVMIDLDKTDLDNPKKHYPIGDLYQRFTADFGLPTTYSIRSGQGGVHLYYDYLPQLPYSNTKGKRTWEGVTIDSRGQGGICYGEGTQWKDTEQYVHIPGCDTLSTTEFWRVNWATGNLNLKILRASELNGLPYLEIGKFLNGEYDLHTLIKDKAKHEWLVWVNAMFVLKKMGYTQTDVLQVFQHIPNFDRTKSEPQLKAYWTKEITLKRWAVSITDEEKVSDDAEIHPYKDIRDMVAPNRTNFDNCAIYDQKAKLLAKPSVDSILSLFKSKAQFASLGDDLYLWAGPNYIRVTEAEVQQMLESAITWNTVKMGHEIYTRLFYIVGTKMKDWEISPTFVAFQNCVLDMATNMIIPESPTNLIRDGIQCNWNPTADCPKFKEMLYTMFEDEDKTKTSAIVEKVGAFLCLGLMHDSPSRFKYNQIWVGKKGMGKTPFVQNLVNLYGKQAIIDNLYRYITDASTYMATAGMTLAAFEEVGTVLRNNEHVENYKAKSTSDKMIGRDLWQKRKEVSDKNYLKVLFITNYLTLSSNLEAEQSEALFDRFDILYANHPCWGIHPENNYIDTVFKTEAEGIMAWIISFYPRLEEILGIDSKITKKRWLESTYIQRFLHSEYVDTNVTCSTSKAQIYDAYKEWFTATFPTPLTETTLTDDKKPETLMWNYQTFCVQMKDAGYRPEREQIDSIPTRVFEGIAVTSSLFRQTKLA